MSSHATSTAKNAPTVLLMKSCASHTPIAVSACTNSTAPLNAAATPSTASGLRVASVAKNANGASISRFSRASDPAIENSLATHIPIGSVVATENDPPGRAKVTASANANPHPASTAGTAAHPRRRATAKPTAPKNTDPANNAATASGWLNTSSAT